MTTCTRIERCLLPPPEIVRWDQGKILIEPSTTSQKAAHYVKNVFACIGLLLASPVTLLYDRFAQRQLAPDTRASETEDPLSKNPPVWPPAHRGFACSLFQTSGLGTKWSAPALFGRCDWDKWMDKPSHIIHPDGFDYRDFFTDVLSDPTAYIQMLKDQNATAHRFSLEWSVIEPKRGIIDKHAVSLYRNFIQKLIEAEITPYATLCHFVVPEWFYESGNFQTIENIDAYVSFALQAIALFPEVENWWSFNEIGIKSFQQAHEAYPTDVPEGSSLAKRVHAAGIATRNMLIAHCKLHQEIEALQEAKQLSPDIKIGVTHQWLKTEMATGNPLERLISYLFTKFCFTPVYRFFKEGTYSFEFPFIANLQFAIPKEEFEQHRHFLMRLGVQTYPQPMIKAGFNHGQTYPGFTTNFSLFSFGSSCEPGGTVMRFGPRWHAEKMDDALEEAFALTDQVFITEYGADARVQKWGKTGFELDDAAQKEYLEKLTERIRDYSARTFHTIQGLFCWSDLRRQMEWDNGHDCKLGLVEPLVDEEKRMTGWQQTPASQYLKEAFSTQPIAACSLPA